MSFLGTLFRYFPGITRGIEKGLINKICRYLDKSVSPNNLPILATFGFLIVGKEQEELIKQRLVVLKDIIHGININIDETGVIKLSVQLNGEPEIIDIRVGYSKREAEGSYYLKINNLNATKPWLVIALEQLILPEMVKKSPTGELAIPEEVYHLLP